VAADGSTVTRSRGSAAPMSTSRPPARICSTATGCVASGGGRTRGSRCTPPNECSPQWASGVRAGCLARAAGWQSSRIWVGAAGTRTISCALRLPMSLFEEPHAVASPAQRRPRGRPAVLSLSGRKPGMRLRALLLI
jgi:hypothetical protein